MDIDMPDKDGYQTTREILGFYKENNSNQEPVIIACTAFNTELEKQKCFENGMRDFIPKPIDRKIFN